MSEERADIRDLRDGGFLWIDKAALELVSKKIGNCGVAVYAWLCYYANSKAQDCFPSIPTLARHCNVSSRTIMRKLKRLEQLKVILIDRMDGRSNVYKLLDVVSTTKRAVEKTSDIHVTGEMDVTGVVTPMSPPPVTPVSPEQELIYQELFNKSTAAFSEGQIKELKSLCQELLPTINLYQFIQTFKSDRGYPPPIDVMITLCQRFKKDKHKIKNTWGWFKRTVDAESAQVFAQANIKEHEQLKKEPACVGRILAQMVNAEKINQGPSDGGGAARVGRSAGSPSTKNNFFDVTLLEVKNAETKRK